MSDAQGLVARRTDLEQELRDRMVEQTAGRICNLAVEVLGDRIQIRGLVASGDLQGTCLGIMEAIRLLRGHAPRVEVGVRITVVRARSTTESLQRWPPGSA